MKSFEVILEGFDGSTDKTDHLVKWVNAESIEIVHSWLKSMPFGTPHMSVHPIDFVTFLDGVDVGIVEWNGITSSVPGNFAK